MCYCILDDHCLGHCFCHRVQSCGQRLRKCWYPPEHLVGCVITILCRIAPLVKWIFKRVEESLWGIPLTASKPLWLHSSSTLFFFACWLILVGYLFIRGRVLENTWSIHAQELDQCSQHVSQSNFDYKCAWPLGSLQDLEKLTKWARNFNHLCNIGEVISIFLFSVSAWTHAWYK